MAVLGNPFVGNAQGVSPDDMVQALRVDVINEFEAVIGYEAHALSTNDERVRKVLHHIADEERQHIGELQQLIAMLCPNEGQAIEKGKNAVAQQQASNFQAPLQ